MFLGPTDGRGTVDGMGILDWFKQPTCEELAVLVLALKDPLAYLDTDGGAGPVFTTWGYQSFDYSVHAGWPSKFTPAGAFLYDPVNAPEEQLPTRRPVARAILATADEVRTAARLLAVYYATPNALRLCPAAQGWFHARGRARALDAIAAYGRAYGFDAGGVAAPVTDVLLKVFAAPAASKSTASTENAVIAAAAQVVWSARTATLDAATWLPLWRWALGGPDGNAAPRTRVLAMQALEAILRRGTLTPQQILMASSLADVLQQLVAQRAQAISAAERGFFLSEASALVAEVTIARQRAVAAMPTAAIVPSAPLPSWVSWFAAAAVAAAAVGGAVAFRRRFARG